MKQKAAEKSLDLTLDVRTGVRYCKVWGDPARLTQIVFNILGNAIKFTHRGEASVVLETVPCEGATTNFVFSVTDTGIGIDPQMQQRIFEPFTQASSSINRQFGGTGLGLAIVRHLVDLHHGEIGITSQLGQGTTFRVELPYQLYEGNSSPEAKTGEDSKPIPDVSFAGIKLLLVEDNHMSVIFMEQLLRRWELEPEIAYDGEEVIDLIRNGRTFDVILMDIHMPKVNGSEAVEFIRDWERTHGGRAHIIALTASVSEEIIGKLNESGFDGYLGKPFNPNDLKHKLEEAEHKLRSAHLGSDGG